MNYTINKRIKSLRLRLNLSQEEFGSRIGVSRSNLGQIEIEKSTPTIETILSIVNVFHINSQYFFIPDERKAMAYLEGKSEDILTVNSAKQQPPLVITLDNMGNDNIAFVDTKAAAGYPVKLVEPEFYRELPAFSLPGGEFRNGLFRCFEVSGDSMADTLYHGDWVICRYLDGGISDIREGYIHVVVTSDQVLVKRVLNRTAKSHKLILQSDNQAYGLYSVTDAEVRELWLVKSKLSFNLPNRNKDIIKTMNELQVKLHDVEERLAEVESKSKGKK